MPGLRPLLTLAALAVPAAGAGAAAETPGRLAVVQGGDESRLVVMHPDGSGATTLVRREFGLQSPAWRPDGRALAFVSSRGGGPGVYVVNDDGTGLRRLVVTNLEAREPAFSPEGRRIAYLGNRGLFVARADGSDRRRLTRAPLELRARRGPRTAGRSRSSGCQSARTSAASPSCGRTAVDCGTWHLTCATSWISPGRRTAGSLSSPERFDPTRRSFASACRTTPSGR